MSARDWRDAMRVREGYWFAPKLFGYGATPVTWQGWVTTLAYVAALAAAVRWLPGTPARLAMVAVLTVPFIAFVHSRTDGGFRWRWGPPRN